MNHESCMIMQQQQDLAPETDPAAIQTIPPAPEPAPKPASEQTPDKVFPLAWERIRQDNPAYTVADFQRDIAVAQARSDVKNAIGLVVTCARRGEPVYAPAELEARLREVLGSEQASNAPAPRQQRHRRQSDRDRVQDRHALPNKDYSPEEHERCRQNYARAQALAQEIAPGDLLVVTYIALDLEAGMSEETACERARQRRAEAGAAGAARPVGAA